MGIGMLQGGSSQETDANAISLWVTPATSPAMENQQRHRDWHTGGNWKHG